MAEGKWCTACGMENDAAASACVACGKPMDDDDAGESCRPEGAQQIDVPLSPGLNRQNRGFQYRNAASPSDGFHNRNANQRNSGFLGRMDKRYRFQSELEPESKPKPKLSISFKLRRSGYVSIIALIFGVVLFLIGQHMLDVYSGVGWYFTREATIGNVLMLIGGVSGFLGVVGLIRCFEVKRQGFRTRLRVGSVEEEREPKTPDRP